MSFLWWFFHLFSKYIANSKGTVYLEQVRLAQELQKYGLEKYLYIGGASLDAIIFLLESAFLHLEEIRKPEFYILRLWEEFCNNL